MDYKLTFSDGSSAFLTHSTLTQEELDERKYAFPEQRKFPLPDRDHVLSAIKFFNYVDPKDEKHLANAILKRMRELGMSEVNVGETNRFKKYYEPSEEDHLAHYGIKGMKWGKWNAETQAKYAHAGGTFSGGGGAVLDEENGESGDSDKPQEKRGIGELASKFGSVLKEGASSKISELKEAASSGKKKIDDWFKYSGNRAKKSQTQTYHTGGEYSQEVYQAKLKNGRRRSWVQEVKGSKKYGTQKTRTPSSVSDKKPSERISASERRWFDISTR